jgi:IS5 family transposase
MLRDGSILDAAIISAPSSTKKESGLRDPEMRQTKKGNPWHFGIKVYIDTTVANVHDIVPAGHLLQGAEQRVFGDAGYLEVQKRDELKDRKNVFWFIAKRPGTRKTLDGRKLGAERLKASASARARAKVEHPFRYIKQI